MIETLPHKHLTEMVVTLWSIWSARRKAIHEGILQSPHAIHSFVLNLIAELEALRRPDTDKATPSRAGASSRQPWKAPPDGAVKIHVDGGFSRTGEKGVATVVCRDHSGTSLGSSALVVSEITDPAILEALACREGLSLALDLGVNELVIACD